MQIKHEDDKLRVIKFSTAIPLVDRRNYLVLNSAKKNVLHIGCVDTGYLSDRMEKGGLLHDALHNVTSFLMGVDVNREGLEQLGKNGYDNLVYYDFASPKKNIEEYFINDFDIIICGEVIEHVVNPIVFIKQLCTLAEKKRAEIIFTTPNPFGVTFFLKAVFGIEHSHSDHNFFISSSNFITLLKKSGFTADIETKQYLNKSSSKIVYFVKHLISQILKSCGDGNIWYLSNIKKI